jgi:hypothetical protein
MLPLKTIPLFRVLDDALAAGMTREQWRRQQLFTGQRTGKRRGVVGKFVKANKTDPAAYDDLSQISLPRAIELSQLSAANYRITAPWTAGIYTGGRRLKSYLRTSVVSLLLAGWPNLIVFASSDTEIDPEIAACVRVIRWPTLVGEFQNFTSSLRALLDDNPDTERVLLCQDDIVCGKDLSGFLAGTPLPDIASLYTPSHYTGKGTGFVDIGFKKTGDGGDLWGSLALTFTRETARELLQHEVVTRHRLARGSDFVVGRFAAATGRKVRYFQPSLVQHIGHSSALPHGGATGNRRASKFVGQDADYNTLISAFAAQPTTSSCIHRGGIAIKACCGGVNVLSCALHGTCTVTRETTKHKYCGSCSDRIAPVI